MAASTVCCSGFATDFASQMLSAIKSSGVSTSANRPASVARCASESASLLRWAAFVDASVVRLSVALVISPMRKVPSLPASDERATEGAILEIWITRLPYSVM